MKITVSDHLSLDTLTNLATFIFFFFLVFIFTSHHLRDHLDSSDRTSSSTARVDTERGMQGESAVLLRERETEADWRPRQVKRN